MIRGEPDSGGHLPDERSHAGRGSSRTGRLRWSVMWVARPSRLRLKSAPELRPGIVAAIGALLAAVAVVAVATHPSWDRWVVAAVIGGSLAAVSLERPRTAAVVALLGLPLLALLRRLLIPLAPWTSHDPCSRSARCSRSWYSPGSGSEGVPHSPPISSPSSSSRCSPWRFSPRST